MVLRKSRAINHIATRQLNMRSLAIMGSDSLDFYELHVSAIREALDAAYRAGAQAAEHAEHGVCDICATDLTDDPEEQAEGICTVCIEAVDAED